MSPWLAVRGGGESEPVDWLAIATDVDFSLASCMAVAVAVAVAVAPTAPFTGRRSPGTKSHQSRMTKLDLAAISPSFFHTVRNLALETRLKKSALWNLVQFLCKFRNYYGWQPKLTNCLIEIRLSGSQHSISIATPRTVILRPFSWMFMDLRATSSSK